MRESMNPCVNPWSQVNIDGWDDQLAEFEFEDIANPGSWVQPYTYMKKIIMAATDPNFTLPAGTAVYVSSELRQIGKTKTVEKLVQLGYAANLDGVDTKADKAKVAEMMAPNQDGETPFQTKSVLVCNIPANDKRLNKSEFYTNIEAYTDNILGTNSTFHLMMGNELPKVGADEVGKHLTHSRLNVYGIVGIGESFEHESLGQRYHDYDLVVDTAMWKKMHAKGSAKFETADYSKKASSAGVDLDVYIFFDTFEAFVPHYPKDNNMMSGTKMAEILKGKHECFKHFLSKKGCQFEKVNFHEWIKDHGQLMTPPGINPVKFKLDGGPLGEMVIVHRYPGHTPHYSLQLKAKSH
jgi:hypothetical protein